MRVSGQSFRIVDLPGSAVSLATEWSCSSYGHFLQDSLPRLAILDRLRVALAGFDHVICGTPTAFSRKLLTLFGVDEGRIVSPRAGVAYRPDLLTATTFPGARRGMERWAAEFIRDRVTGPTRSGRRIYILRKTRRPINEDALLPILRASGFELYSPEEDQDNQAKTFSEASIVLGSAGSAFANLLFCRPSTQVLELLPTRHMYPYYFLLSNAAGLRYGNLVCAVDEGSLRERGARKADFHVDPEHFAAAISSLVLEDA
jgi:capsular polysaccharide biosynthesis protein